MVQCSSFVGGRFQKFFINSGPELLVGDLQLNLRLMTTVFKIVLLCGVVMTTVFKKSPNGFFLLTGNTSLWVQFPQTSNFSVEGIVGCHFLNKGMSLLHLFLRGYMCFTGISSCTPHCLPCTIVVE